MLSSRLVPAPRTPGCPVPSPAVPLLALSWLAGFGGLLVRVESRLAGCPGRMEGWLLLPPSLTCASLLVWSCLREVPLQKAALSPARSCVRAHSCNRFGFPVSINKAFYSSFFLLIFYFPIWVRSAGLI